MLEPISKSQAAQQQTSAAHIALLKSAVEQPVIPESMLEPISKSQAAQQQTSAAQYAAVQKALQQREIVQKITAEQAAAELSAARSKGSERVWTPEKDKSRESTESTGALPEIGALARVTDDASFFEAECKTSGLSWPNGPDLLPRSSKLGAVGRIEKIDLTDFTVHLGSTVRWIPIATVVGYEDFRRQQ